MRTFLACMAVLNLLSCVSHFVISARAYKRGYKEGQIRCDNWWLGMDLEVEKEREKMRREEV